MAVSIRSMLSPSIWAARSQKILQDFEEQCEQLKIPKTPFLGNGKPGEAIVDYAKEHNAHLIVMGSRGLNSVRRTFLGSVSDYVICHAHLPVVVLPPPKYKHKEEVSGGKEESRPFEKDEQADS